MPIALGSCLIILQLGGLPFSCLPATLCPVLHSRLESRGVNVRKLLSSSDSSSSVRFLSPDFLSLCFLPFPYLSLALFLLSSTLLLSARFLLSSPLPPPCLNPFFLFPSPLPFFLQISLVKPLLQRFHFLPSLFRPYSVSSTIPISVSPLHFLIPFRFLWFLVGESDLDCKSCWTAMVQITPPPPPNNAFFGLLALCAPSFHTCNTL